MIYQQTFEGLEQQTLLPLEFADKVHKSANKSLLFFVCKEIKKYIKKITSHVFKSWC